MGKLEVINDNEIYSEGLGTVVEKKSLVTPFFFIPINEEKGKIAYDDNEPYGTFINSYLPDYVKVSNSNGESFPPAYRNRLYCDCSYCVDLSMTNLHIVLQDSLFDLLNRFSKVGNIYDMYIKEIGTLDVPHIKNMLTDILFHLIAEKDNIDIKSVISETISYFGNNISGFLYSIINYAVFTDKLNIDEMFEYFNKISGIDTAKSNITIEGVPYKEAKDNIKYSIIVQFLLNAACYDLDRFYDLLTPAVLGVVSKIKNY